MRPISLKIKGLNSFLEEQVVDFEALTSRGLFGIFGPTGSGKTSILDGITLSLYGDISRTTKEFINTNTDTAVVSFEFEIAGNTRRRYRVERAFKGSKAGGVTTKHARIIQVEGGIETIVEDRPTKVNEACEAIIGLTKEDFTRTVVLPQGKFSDFLKLKNKERGEMLERLFNLQAYGDELTAKLQRRAKQVRQKETELSGELKAYVDVTPEAIETQTQQLAQQTQALEQAKMASVEADKTAEQAQGIWQLQLEQTRVTEKQNKHLEGAAAIAEKDSQIASAEAARQLMPQVLEWERLAKSHEELKRQLESLSEKRNQQQTEHEVVKQAFERVSAEKEQELPKLQAKQVQLEAAVADKQTLLAGRSKLAEDELTLEKLAADLTALQAKAVTLAEQKEKLTLTIQQTEADLEPLRQPETYRSALSGLYALWNQQVTEQSQLEKLNFKENEQRTNLERLKAELAESTSLQQQSMETWEALQMQLERVKAALPSSEALVAKASELERLKQAWTQYERLTQLQAENLKQGEILATQQEPLQAELKHLTKTVERLSEKLKQLGLEAQASQLRALLKDGEACLVCGSTHHPFGHQLSMPLDDAEAEAEQLKTAEQQLKETELRLMELDSRRHLLDQQADQYHLEIKRLGAEFLSQPLEAAEQAYAALLMNAQSGQAQLETLQKDSLAAQEKLNLYQRQVATCETALKSSQAQLNVLLNELSQLRETAGATQLKVQTEQHKLDIIDISLAYETMQANATASEALVTQLRELRKQEAELQTAEQQDRQQLKTAEEAHLQLKTHCQLTARNLQDKAKQLETLFGRLEMLEQQLVETQNSAEQLKQRYEAARVSFEASGDALKALEESYQGTVHQYQLQGENRERAEGVLREQLSHSVFEKPKDVKANYLELEILEGLKSEVRQYREEGQRLSGALDQLMQQLAGRTITEGVYQEAMTAKAETQRAVKAFSDACVALQTSLTALKQRYEQMSTLIEEKVKVDRELAQVADLEKLFQGKRFVAYMAAHRLKYISGKASEQLFDISMGNYGIETDEEGNFAIRDYKNGGVLRDPSSLSGGETFMVSLALALALSAQIQLKGTAPLEFFFLDEGFGTLDEDTLEVVLSALERLHHERLSIGLISHVESIKNRVPIKLVVSPACSGLGGSRVKIELS